MPVRPYDVARKGSCASMEISLTPNADRCIPQIVGYVEKFYSDSACTVPIALSGAGSCPFVSDDVPTAAWVYYFGMCGTPPITLSALGKPLSSSDTVYQNFSSCMPSSSNPTQFTAVGADIPVTSLPTLNRTTTGSGRAVQKWQTSVTGDHLLVEWFHDNTLALDCEARIAHDATLRCLPHADDDLPVFTDSSCTTPLLAWSKMCPTSPPPATVRIQLPISYCGGQYAYFSVGSKVATPAALWSLNGTCTPLVVDMSADYYALSETPASMLAPLTDVTE